MIKLIRSKGKGSHLFKRDLKRAYRQIFVDPGDIHLLGYKWKGHLYFDRVLTMGLRSEAYICKKNEIEILNYFDDLAGCETVDKSNFAFVWKCWEIC